MKTPRRADGVRAGASATGADATSAHMYICVGLRLSSADLVAVFFSAFWLRSSVVSVLISVTTDMSPTGDLLVTLIFVWGGVLLSLLRDPRVLHWHGT